MLGGCFLMALTLATALPLANVLKGTHLLYTNGLSREFFLGMKTVEALGVGSLLYAVHLRNNPNYYFLAGGMALVAVGREILLYPGGGILINGSGFLGLVLGTIIFGSKTHEVHLWF